MQGSRGLRIAALLGWMAVIFIMSADSGSGGHSSYIVRGLAFLYSCFGFAPPSPEALDIWHSVLRKGAHMGEYAVLYFLSRRCPLGVRGSFLLCAAYACSDEWHQTFVPNRAGTLADVGIDCMGAFLAVLCERVCAYLRSRRQNPENSVGLAPGRADS